MSENCIIIMGLMFPCQSCVFAPRIQNEHRKPSGELPGAFFGERTKRKAAKLAKSPWIPQRERQALLHQPVSLPQAEGSPNYSPPPLQLSRPIPVCPLGPF